jgi:methionine-rich copper-binding protein CopC
MTRTLRRWVVLAALAAALGGLGAGPASAHDELIATNPAVDATVQQAPTSVTPHLQCSGASDRRGDRGVRTGRRFVVRR